MRRIILNGLISLKSKGKRKKVYSVMKKYEFKSLKENKELEEEKLRNILLYAYNNVPYYNKILSKTKITNNNQVDLNKFNKIPILTKEILRNEFYNLKSKNFKGKFKENTSGGSTGEPAIFLQDSSYSEAGKAAKDFFYEWAGRQSEDKLIKLWGSERDILKGNQGFQGVINRHLLNIHLLNSFKMSEKDMDNYVKKINKFKPKVIEAYVQSIYELANFIKKNQLNVYSPKGIITSAGTLYPEIKKTIEEVFKCKVYNRYGSREVGDIACSCEKDEGLHLNVFTNYVEILNDKLNPCKPGEIGKVYVTTLNNYVMPLIRYDIGDMAVPSKNEQCSCGRGLPLISNVEGRENSIIRTNNTNKEI